MREKRSRRKVKNKKFPTLLASFLLIFTVAIGGTAAYLVANTDPVVNTFTPGTINSDITEVLEGNVKKSVSIKNNGTVDVYVRTMVLVTWKNSNGNVYKEAPVEGTDYSMNIPGTNWVESGNYYYYKGAVSNGTSTTPLLTEGKLLETANIPDGYELSIEIFAQMIQAEPAAAVKTAWGDTAAELVGATNSTN